MSDAEVEVKLNELRANVSRAIQEFVEYQQSEVWGREGAFVLGWIVGAEATTPELERAGLALPCTIAPDGQMAATSVGLHYTGISAYARRDHDGP